MEPYQTRHRRTTLGIHIEGIGAPVGVDAPDGALFCYGYNPTDVVSTLPAEIADMHFEQALASLPGDLDQSVDPLQGTQELSSSSFDVVATDAICQRLMTYAGQEKARANLDQELWSGSGEAWVYSQRPIAEGDYLFVGDETLYVHTLVTSDGSTYRVAVTRGVGRTTPTTHAQGNNVYTGPTSYKDRMVRLYQLDWDAPAGEEVVKIVWRGRLDDIYTNGDQTHLVLSCLEGPTAMGDSKGNSSPTALVLSDSSLHWEGKGVKGIISPAENNDFMESVWKDGEQQLVELDWAVPGAAIKIIRVGDALAPFTLSDSGLSARDGRTVLFSTHGEDSGGTVESDVDCHEVLCYSRHGDYQPHPFATLYGCSSADANPISVALALILSTGEGSAQLGGETFDVLGSKWALGMDPEFLHAPSWFGAIDSVDQSIDWMLLGWDGGFDFDEVINQQLLGALDYYAATNNQGQLQLYKYDTFTTSDADQLISDRAWSIITPTRIKLDRELSKRVGRLTAHVSGLECTDVDPTTISTQILRGNKTDKPGSRVNTLERNFGLYEASNANVEDIQRRLDTLAVKNAQNPPVFSVEVPIEHADTIADAFTSGVNKVPPVGQFVVLSEGEEQTEPTAGLIGPDGVRIHLANTNSLRVGLVIGRTIDYAHRQADLKVWMVNWATGDRVARVVAPSLAISEDGSSAPTYSTLSVYNHAFKVGDDVSIWQPDGRPWWGDPGGLEIVAINIDGTVTLNKILKTVPEQGLIVRCGKAFRFSNDNWSGSALFTGTYRTRQYAYLAFGGWVDGDQEPDFYS